VAYGAPRHAVQNSASRLWLARRMAQMLAGALPGRAIHVVADAAYAGTELKKLQPGITWTTRLRSPRRVHGRAPGGRADLSVLRAWPCSR
jgi:hypothetical protein